MRFTNRPSDDIRRAFHDSRLAFDYFARTPLAAKEHGITHRAVS
jgi:hypothetical protein